MLRSQTAQLHYTQYTVTPSTKHKSENSLQGATHAMCLEKQMTSLELDYSVTVYCGLNEVSVKKTKLNIDLAGPSDHRRLGGKHMLA